MFGRVIDGMLTLRKIENVPTGPNNRPKLAVKIVGQYLPRQLATTIALMLIHNRVRRDVKRRCSVTISRCNMYFCMMPISS